MALFGKKKDDSGTISRPAIASSNAPILIVAGRDVTDDPTLAASLTREVAVPFEVISPDRIASLLLANTQSCVAIGLKAEQLKMLADKVFDERMARTDGTPTLVVAVHLASITEFGIWLYQQAVSEKLSGVRLLTYQEPSELPSQLSKRICAQHGSNFIKMPIAPEVENSGFKYFYVFSPELHEIVRIMGELAENNMTRVYLLGAPGTGKTSIAYYFWLKRAKGNFVTVNLSSESTGDKASMKSLLCGHVAGSIAGAGAREGALSFARDGVCFLDESHGVTGSVMQILMEVLETGQFLPFGATAKRMLDCAVVFASNRSWETLRGMMHLDEHARLGATIVGIPNLAKREEDQIAILGSVLATFRAKCRSWRSPDGISREGWALLQRCPWRGNTRTLIRVLETACVKYASSKTLSTVIEPSDIEEALRQWEPEDKHQDDGLYTSY